MRMPEEVARDLVSLVGPAASADGRDSLRSWLDVGEFTFAIYAAVATAVNRQVRIPATLLEEARYWTWEKHGVRPKQRPHLEQVLDLARQMATSAA